METVLQPIEWLNFQFLGNSLESYIIAIAIFSLIWGGAHFIWNSILKKLTLLNQKAPNDLLCLLIDLLGSLHPAIFPLVALRLSVQRLTLGAFFEKALTYTIFTIIVIQILVLSGRAISFTVSRLKIGRGGDQITVDSTRKNLTITLKIILWIAGILFLFDNFGINVSTFVTGLGIGGIAVALAAQTILGDTFSSFTIALDKAFEVGDFIAVDALSGTVEHIGLKTTRVRSLSGELLIFSNSDLTKARIKNFKKMDFRRVTFMIGVVYDTPLNKLKKIPNIVKESVESTEKSQFDRAHFVEFGPSSLIYDIVYLVQDRHYGTYMDIHQEINFKIHEKFDKEGIVLAAPVSNRK